MLKPRLLAAHTDRRLRLMAERGDQDAIEELATRGLTFHSDQHKKNSKLRVRYAVQQDAWGYR